jgi:hypothetical protein
MASLAEKLNHKEKSLTIQEKKPLINLVDTGKRTVSY